MRAAGIRSLLKALGPESAADAPAVLVFSLGYLDGSTGAPMTEVAFPRDVGRRLRATVELFGADVRPLPRIVRARLRADTGAGGADPILGERTVLVPAAGLDPRNYGSMDRPAVSVEWTVADVPGSVGFYVELDEKRLGGPGDDAADPLLTTEMSRLQGVMGGRPHYVADYGTYAQFIGAIPRR